jgi:hypothetical protein
MKIDCKIKIQDRQRTNGSATLKAAKGVIGLAKSNGDEWALIVRLFKDTSATQYKVLRIRFQKSRYIHLSLCSASSKCSSSSS